MEKILRAVEKAREERFQKKTGNGNANILSHNSRSHKSITYTQTKKISLSNEQYRASRIIEGSGNQSVIDAYKILRTQVLRRMKQNNWKSLGVTSARSNEGKSLTAINLALSLAKETNHTVLLVDLDLRKPGLHDFFYHKPTLGLSDYLLYDVELQDVMINPGIERLVLIPGRNSISESSELLCSSKMVNLSSELIGRYPERLIIYDLPPLLDSDDTIAFLPNIDSVLLVVEEGSVTKNEVQKATSLLHETPLLGTVLNKTKEKAHAY